MRQELGQTTRSIQGQSRSSLYIDLIEEQVGQIKMAVETASQTPHIAHQVWRHGRSLADRCRTEADLAQEVGQLDAAVTNLEQTLRVAVATTVAQYEKNASAATDIKTARSAWSQAGSWLRYYPLNTEQKSMEAYQALLLAHEAVRQNLQQRFSAESTGQ